MKQIGPLLLIAGVAFFITSSANARTVADPKVNSKRDERHQLSSATLPIIEYAIHDRGNIQLVVANNGTFGTLGQTERDLVTGAEVQSCIYPKNSDIVFLWVSAIWIGAVVGRDTLVTCGNEDFYVTQELWPDIQPFGNFVRTSIDINSPFYSPDAYSEQDYYCEYTDTFTDPNLVAFDETDARPHKPLNVKVQQRSMAWSYSYANDFILFDYQVQNIGVKPLSNVYLGIYVDGDTWHSSRNGPEGWDDDMVGFYRTHPAPEGCGFIDTVNIAFHCDEDGDPSGGTWDSRSARSVLATRVIRTPSTSLQYSFNWWITNYGDESKDFGPRMADSPEHPFRNFGGRLGTPEGDKNKYYVMRNDEFDYDLMYCALNHSSEGWLPPPPDAEDFAQGWDTRYLLSFGPFDINPGENLPISFAWIGGENFHRNPTDFADLFDAHDPQTYYDALDFTDLAVNSRWASWVYDNPGVDSDGDGYYGKFRLCVNDSVLTGADTIIVGTDTTITPHYQYTDVDTFYYEGDGVPDFRGAGPPPSPLVKIIPEEGKLTIRWNGFYSENTPDIFSRLIDFEGYRVYYSRDNRPSSLSLLTSYDRDDYNRYRAITDLGSVEWVLEDIPFTRDSLKIIYGDSTFDPTVYTRLNPLLRGGETYYFAPQDFNSYHLGGTGEIRKVYPNATDPGPDSTQWTDDDVTTEHGRRLPKFYEYEYVLDSVLPTVPYYIAVTTFDFGSPSAGLPALESDPVNNLKSEYALPPASTVAEKDLPIYVYPNPYRTDAGYRADGFEGRRTPDLPDDRVRAIHFVNLPYKCTIRIYSLDGDLVQTIAHDRAEGDSESSHDQWDLITRNHQTVVSGLYYYVVESEQNTQIGKFMIIR